MTRKDREEEVTDAADGAQEFVANFADDVVRERRIPLEDAIKLAMAGVRRVAREGFDGRR